MRNATHNARCVLAIAKLFVGEMHFSGKNQGCSKCLWSDYEKADITRVIECLAQYYIQISLLGLQDLLADEACHKTLKIGITEILNHAPRSRSGGQIYRVFKYSLFNLNIHVQSSTR